MLGIRMDRHGRLWVLDHGKLGLHRPRLYAFDVQSNAKVVDVTFDSKVAGFGSILNDVQISPDGLTAYISDASIVAGKPAILVVELGGPKPTVRRVLEKHASVMQGDFDVYVNGTKAKFAGLLCAGAGVDGIALDGAGTYLYYTALNSGWLYRVPTAALRDASQSPAPFVEQFAPSTMSDGMISDLAGNVYLTDMEHSQVVRVKPDRSLEVVATDAKMRWPDGLSWTADGALLLTNSAIHQTMSDLIRTRNGIKSRGPYHVLRLGLGGGIVGQ